MLDNNANLTEARVEMDFDGSTNDFAHNYFFFAIRPNDLVGAVASTQTSLQAQQQAIQRQSINNTILSDLPSNLTEAERAAAIAAEIAALTPEEQAALDAVATASDALVSKVDAIDTTAPTPPTP